MVERMGYTSKVLRKIFMVTTREKPELLNEEKPRTIIKDRNPHERKVLDISREEVKKTLEKTVGPGGISVEVWKCLAEEGIDILRDLMTQIYHQERMLDIWRNSQMVLIFKGKEKFKVKVGLHQGSALSPYVFDIVMDVISLEISEEGPRCAMLADDIMLADITREGV
ncbi:uncharacterized protein [Palaemon carinicauda]|uniref:uncharacterized protein n=1 Tax=Palaemon carinicauda TaxID=392227 RepID=UPI0035B5F565